MENVKTELTDAVTASFQVAAAAGVDTPSIGGLILKGTYEGKVGFQAQIDGTVSGIRSSIAAALKDVLGQLDRNPANYAVGEVKWADIKPSNKKAPEPETLDDLEGVDPEQAKAFRAGYAKLEKAIAADDKATETKRKRSMAVAAEVVSLRGQFADKTAWSRFTKMATETIADYMGKNGISEHFKAGRLADALGDGFDGAIPPRVTGAKGVVTHYTAVIKAVAEHVAEAIAETDTGLDAASLKALGDLAGALTTEGGQNVLTGEAEAMARVVVPEHVANWKGFQGITLDDAGRAIVATDENGRPNVPSLYGLEGGDELVKAIAAAINAHKAEQIAAQEREQAEADADAVSEAVADMAAEGEESGPITGWAAELVARHLAKVAGARVDAEDGDARLTVAVDILNDLEALLMAIAKGEIGVGDVMTAQMPETEE